MEVAIKQNLHIIESIKKISNEIIQTKEKVKDDEGTFKYILEKEKIIPSETIFIDDNEDNIEMANREVIQGIVFQNAKQLEYELKKMQII